jgi:hypothetical protein
MLKVNTRNLALALTLAALAVPYGRAIAQSTGPAQPSVVTGTDPEPQMIAIILLSLIPSA